MSGQKRTCNQTHILEGKLKMKNLLVYHIEWDNPNRDLDFGASLPRVMYLTLKQDEENLTKETIAEKISKLWFRKHRPISFNFREATVNELNDNSKRNAWPLMREF